MTATPPRSTRSRILAIGASLALALGLTATGATATQATPGGYTISGIVHDKNAVALDGVEVTLTVPDPGYSDTVYTKLTGSDGIYDFTDIRAGGPYSLAFWLDGYGYETTTVTVVATNVTVPSQRLLPLTDASGATATISGTGEIGTALTVTNAGWPTGTVFTYQWFAPDGRSSGDIVGAESASYTVTRDVVGRDVFVWVTGHVPDETAGVLIDSANSVTAYDNERPTGAAPADLATYLTDNNSTPADPTTAGLPSGPINPGTDQTAEVEWAGADSFVDVYAFSSPVRVGTFRVTKGVASIKLTRAVLGQLTTGSHTLVITGQTSGTVQSVRFSVGLAATGDEFPVAPLGIAGLLALTGTALLIARRRSVQA